ncbi:hypothetical protein DY245_22405 [Streptomyces inhibens]|uniref:Uncharacterized protein n=1 Tax=Streptomyces inhibens TaxID=2293571 RepID=A0A371Q0L9_STRIH|nr:hypothetical protein [Streptomyces inhibens]REK88255.1 hypothetical protein DY245_22405 [Streptomyces inhibens]
MEAETLAGLFGLGGALVGAAVSTGAVVWQQRKTAHEAERAHLLGLAEAAANECIRLSYAIQEHFARGVGDTRSPHGREWHKELQRMNRALEEQALRFSDKEIRNLLSRCHAEILIRADWVGDPDGFPPRYITLCNDIRTVMGTVLRRQPFPGAIWQNYPDPTEG